MTPKRLEEQTINLLDFAESDFGQSGRDVRLLAIRDELISVFHEGMEEAAKICQAELLVENTGHLEDDAYDRGVTDCIKAIREVKDKL